MALLTAEDVLNKAFSKTKYREGFDQDEVDDFLDEVANTIAQLTAERDELSAKVAGGSAVAAEPAAPASTGLLAAATEPGAANPTGMLAMAQKLHDEYVQAGEAERDRIIDEAHAAADQIRERADEDAKARMEELSGERADIEARIDDLRRFERDYRARLRTYLENLLGDLDHSGIAGSAPAEAAPVAPVVDSEPAVQQEAQEPEAQAEPAMSFEEALGGADAEQLANAEQLASTEQPANTEQPATPAPPVYDANQSWESQLREPSPFQPVTQQQEATPASDDAVPVVAQPQEGDEPPYTPPSSRMFNELYTQQRPDQDS